MDEAELVIRRQKEALAVEPRITQPRQRITGAGAQRGGGAQQRGLVAQQRQQPLRAVAAKGRPAVGVTRPLRSRFQQLSPMQVDSRGLKPHHVAGTL